MSPRAIAELRHVKLDTVESYLAEAITAGKAYDWHRLHVSEGVLATISEFASAQLAAAEEQGTVDFSEGMTAELCKAHDPRIQQHACMASSSHTDPGRADVHATSCHEDKENLLHPCSLQQQLRPSRCAVSDATGRSDELHMSSSISERHAGCSTSAPAAGADMDRWEPQKTCHGKRAHSMPSALPKSPGHSSAPCLQHYTLAIDLSPGSSLAEQGAPRAHSPRGIAGESGSKGSKPELLSRDLLGRLQEQGCTIKTLQEQLPESIRFGQIRLCLAHAGRLSPW